MPSEKMQGFQTSALYFGYYIVSEWEGAQSISGACYRIAFQEERAPLPRYVDRTTGGAMVSDVHSSGMGLA